MTPKQYLRQAFVLDRLIKANMTRIEELREIQMWMYHTAAGEHVQSSRRMDQIGEITARFLDAMAETAKDIMQLMKLQHEIITTINALPRSEHRLVLYERYINMKKWEEIAEESNYDVRTIYRLHGKALSEIKKMSVNVSMIHDIM